MPLELRLPLLQKCKNGLFEVIRLLAHPLHLNLALHPIAVAGELRAVDHGLDIRVGDGWPICVFLNVFL